MAKLETQYYDPAEAVRLKREGQGPLNLEVRYDGTLLWTDESQQTSRQRMEKEGATEKIIKAVLRSQRVGFNHWMLDCITADGSVVWQNPNEKDEFGNERLVDISRPEIQSLRPSIVEMSLIGEWANNPEISAWDFVLGQVLDATREGFREILVPHSAIGQKWQEEIEKKLKTAEITDVKIEIKSR